MNKPKTVEDLWPGDVIIATQPGSYIGRPSRFSHVEPLKSPDMVRVHLSHGDYEFTVMASLNERVQFATDVVNYDD